MSLSAKGDARSHPPVHTAFTPGVPRLEVVVRLGPGDSAFTVLRVASLGRCSASYMGCDHMRSVFCEL